MPKFRCSRRIASGVTAVALVAFATLDPWRVMASSWQPALLVNTEAFQTIDDSDSTADLYIQFGDALAKTLTYERSIDRFNFNDDVHTTGSLTASGTLTVDGDVKTKADLTINSDNGAADAVLTFGSDGTPETVTFANTNDRFEFSDDIRITGNLSTSGNVTLSGAVVVGSTIKLNGVTYTFPYSDGTSSGKVLKSDGAGNLVWSTDSTGAAGGISYAEAVSWFVDDAGDTMTGSLTVKNVLSGSSLVVPGTVTIKGVAYNFPRFDGSSSGKVLKTDGAGNLSWSTDSTGAGGGISYAEAVSYFVDDKGDTMTGALSIAVTGGTNDTVALELPHTASGRVIRAQDSLRSSGSLLVEGTTGFNNINYIWPAAPATSSGKVLKVNPATGQLSWSTDEPKTVVSTANTSDSATGTPTTVTNLTVPVAASTNYIIRCLLTTNSATTTTGVQITVNGPSSPTQVTWTRKSCSSTTALVNASINAFGTEDVRTASAGATRCVEPIDIHLRNGSNAGNVTFGVDTEIGASAVTVYTGSFCDYQSY